MIRKLQLGALCAALALATGCATITQQDLDAVRSIAESAQSSAADAARQAGEARQMASGAQSTANQALSAANAAQANNGSHSGACAAQICGRAPDAPLASGAQ